MERILDLVPLIESGQLKMGGGISPGLLGSIRIERFHVAVEDWFRNKGRTFDAKNYNKYQKAHDKWEGEDSTRILEHQFRRRDAECTCGPELPEPKKSDYFPSEPSARSLSKVLASVSRVRHIDGLPIAVRTASCNRRHEDDGSLSGERAEDEGSTLEENERA
jgi:hypothetical protein